MSKLEDNAIGLSPITIRRAAYYAQLGVGEYYPDHPHFNKVTVSLSYPVQQSAVDSEEWGFGLLVSFYLDELRIHWIEFSARTVGAGGVPRLKEVKTNE